MRAVAVLFVLLVVVDYAMIFTLIRWRKSLPPVTPRPLRGDEPRLGIPLTWMELLDPSLYDARGKRLARLLGGAFAVTFVLAVVLVFGSQ